MWGTLAHVAIAFLVIVSGLSDAQGAEFTFGVYRTDRASQVYKKFKPVIKELEQRLQTATGEEVRVKMKIFKSYSAARDALVEREIDFARFGPASYVLAKEADPEVRLLAMELKKGKTQFNGVIVVPVGSKLKSLADLRGKRFAFGDPSSTIGRYLAQSQLMQAGVHGRDLKSFEYLGRHDLVAKRVALKDFDAGSLKESTFKAYATKLRVLHTFVNVTKPWVARGGMSQQAFSTLQQSLLALESKDALKVLKVSGFLETSDGEYEIIRQSIKLSSKF